MAMIASDLLLPSETALRPCFRPSKLCASDDCASSSKFPLRAVSHFIDATCADVFSASQLPTRISGNKKSISEVRIASLSLHCKLQDLVRQIASHAQLRSGRLMIAQSLAKAIAMSRDLPRYE